MPGYAGPTTCGLEPDGDQAFLFLLWWFNPCREGMIELGWMNPDRGGLTNFKLFDLEDESIADFVREVNSIPGQSLYYRACTVQPAVPGKTNDKDFVQAPGPWGDHDNPEQMARARSVSTLIRPNGSIITGTIPYQRVQSFFRCEDPIEDPHLMRQLNTRIHALYGGDPAVTNPTRLMRLPGTIAWPWKKDRVPELTSFVQAGGDRIQAYPIDMLQAQLPKIVSAPSAPACYLPSAPIGTSGFSAASGFVAQIQAGEQWHNTMVRLVAHMAGIGKTDAEIMAICPEITLPGYQLAQTEREVASALRGARAKWGETVVGTTAIPPPTVAPDQSEQIDHFPILNTDEIDALPPVQWLIDGILTQDSFGITYGQPGSMKSFLVLDWSLCIASGTDWKGHKVSPGGVLYIAGEGVRGVGKRIRAWRRANKMEGVHLPFSMVPVSVNLNDGEQITKVVRTAQAAAAREGSPIIFVVIDTVARSIPGADENSAQDMGQFVAAIEYIQRHAGVHVHGVHHSGKDDDRGARGSSALKGAADTMVHVKKDEDGQSLLVKIEKQKDGEDGQKIRLKARKVELLKGMEPEVSLVLDDDQPKKVTHAPGLDIDLLRRIAAVLGEDGKMSINAIGTALNMTGGTARGKIREAVPFYPDYHEIEIADGRCRLFQARSGTAENATINLNRTDV